MATDKLAKINAAYDSIARQRRCPADAAMTIADCGLILAIAGFSVVPIWRCILVTGWRLLGAMVSANQLVKLLSGTEMDEGSLWIAPGTGSPICHRL